VHKGNTPTSEFSAVDHQAAADHLTWAEVAANIQRPPSSHQNSQIFDIPLLLMFTLTNLSRRRRELNLILPGLQLSQTLNDEVLFTSLSQAEFKFATGHYNHETFGTRGVN
jgi:hypothetical protein